MKTPLGGVFYIPVINLRLLHDLCIRVLTRSAVAVTNVRR